ncbi:hypothetical protein pdam_00015260 [Pocillopora damicornis]|uniref:Prokineticin domain-containing protein n=2 Tax=Pocillopora damicornis TaxID=46731 RepID=A0A3M6UHZ9_POCDA|nr:hypothetical protein pdam_00015260 [Pocillopora damicornis]
MKSLAVLTLFFSLSVACSNLPKYSACETRENSHCSCAPGLACKVTREIDMGEQTAEVKQCMPVNEPIVVEKLTEYDVNETLDPGSAALDPAARFYPGKKCTTAADCFWPNTCCLFSKRCSLKLLKYFTCYLRSVHKCGCQEHLVCKTTTHVTLPIVKIPFPIRQCVPEDEA